jgi:hypothetical protein
MNGLENKKRVAYFEYDFAKHGGGPGDIDLYGDGIPIGSVINNGIIHVRTACTHASTGSIALKAIGANDIKAACVMASLTANALVPTVPVGTAATSKRVTSSINKLVMTVGSAGAMTAGKFTVALDYWITD